MSDKSEPKTVRATATRDFGDYDDDNNPRRFVKDQPYDLPEGVFANFAAVGLVVAAAVDKKSASASPGA